MPKRTRPLSAWGAKLQQQLQATGQPLKALAEAADISSATLYRYLVTPPDGATRALVETALMTLSREAVRTPLADAVLTRTEAENLIHVLTQHTQQLQAQWRSRATPLSPDEVRGYLDRAMPWLHAAQHSLQVFGMLLEHLPITPTIWTPEADPRMIWLGPGPYLREYPNMHVLAMSLLGKPISTLITPESWQALQPRLLQLLSGESSDEPIPVHWAPQHVPEWTMPITGTWHSTRDDQGRVTALVAFYRRTDTPTHPAVAATTTPS
jgi:hypothetical protein